MAADKNKKLIFGGIGGVIVIVVAVLLGKSLTSDDGAQTRPRDAPVVRDTDSEFDEAQSSVATRTAPTESRSRNGRLAGSSDNAAIDEEDNEDEAVVGKKTNRGKKRRSRKQKSAEDSEEEEGATKGGKREVINKPF